MEKRRVIKRIGCAVMTTVLTVTAVFMGNITEAASTAWTKIDGVFVNSAGDEIEGAVLKGIDVSYHNKDIDWQKVKDSDIDYAIIRCGYGQNFESQDDSKWEEYAQACTELEIPFGTYLYSYATTVEAAKSEAEHVLRVIDGYQLTYPVYYDMEDSKQEATSAKLKAQMAEAFCTIIEEAGYQVGIYANTNWFENKLTNSYFDSRDKWVAQYNSVCKYTGNYRMWQCTSEGTVPGISGNVDLNFWFDQPPVYQGNTPSNNQGTETEPDSEENTGTENNPNPNQNTGTDIGTDSNQNAETNSSGNTNTDQNTETNSGESIKPNENTGASSGENKEPDQNAGTNSDEKIEVSQSTITKPNENNTDDSSKELIISQDTLTLSYGGTSVLTSSQEVTWSSSDKSIVKVGSKGKVTPVSVGDAVIIATASTGKTAECKVTIKKPVKDTVITPIPDQQFTGSQIRPAVTIQDGEKELVKGTDYKVTYSNNMAKGTATITIKGKGYYTGKTTVSFQIVPKEKLAAPVLTEISSEKNVVTLKWKKVTQATGYEIYRATGKNGEYILRKSITKKSKITYQDKKLTKGKKYYYKIRAYKTVNGKKQYSSYTKMNIKAG